MQCFRTTFLVEAQDIRQITQPGDSIQYIRFEKSTNVLFYSDVGKKTIHRYDPFALTDQVLQLGKVYIIRNVSSRFITNLLHGHREIVLLATRIPFYLVQSRAEKHIINFGSYCPILLLV